MRAPQYILKPFLLLVFISSSYFTRSRETQVEEGPGSFESGSGDLLAGALLMLFIPFFIASLLAYLHAFRGDASRWTVRWARHLSYVLALSAHILAVHLGEWNAVFNPVAILLNQSESLTIRVICSALSLFFLAATLPGLLAFLDAGRPRTISGAPDAHS